jgi:NAD(P)-dependent dehydrogenase (short-subunit alcohol dehydrogenase family)
MGSFTGKVALVAGGTSGIGRAAAVALAREGAKVVVAGRRKAEGGETVRLVREAGSQGLFVRADVAKESDVRAMIEATLAEYGRLDAAFNNAGVEEDPGPLGSKGEEVYDHIMDVNVKGVWLSLKHEIPAMLRTGGGSIVNTSSVAGVIGMAGVAIYVASKHAVIGLTKAVALEFAKEKVRVNAVSPAAIDTAMFERFAGDKPELRSAVMGAHPVGRMGTPEEIADAVVWLLSDKASFVTGTALLADGGFTAA